MEFFEEYFEGIASKLVAIQHGLNGNKGFFLIDDWDNPTEILKEAGRNITDRILILEDFEDHLSDNYSDNFTGEIYSAFTVLEHVSDSRGDKKEAKYRCRAIAKKIAHKLKLDGMDGILAERRIICKLDSKGFSVGPVLSNYYGWRYSFSWKEPERIALNSEDWLP
jgi:hypothetical protein